MLDRHGAPVTGLEVTARAHRLASRAGSPPLRRRSALPARSDADGRFEIEGLQAGEYEITAEADERYGAASVIVRAGVDSAVLTVVENRMYQIIGTVTSASGERLAGVKVMPPPGSSGAVLTDLEGRYSLALNEGRTVGRRYLRFLLDGYQETRLVLESLFDPDQPVTVVDTTLTPLGTTVTVSGRISDEYGSAVAGERVQFHSRSRYTTYRATSGSDGKFMVEGVAVSDDYRVWVRPKKRYGDYNQAFVALTNDEPYFDIVLPSLATGTVSGRVLDGRLNPVPGFHFWLRSASAEGRALQVTTDADGSFAVEQVPVGRLTLGTRSLPHVRIDDIELAAGAVQYVEVVLDEGF